MAADYPQECEPAQPNVHVGAVQVVDARGHQAEDGQQEEQYTGDERESSISGDVGVEQNWIVHRPVSDGVDNDGAEHDLRKSQHELKERPETEPTSIIEGRVQLIDLVQLNLQQLDGEEDQTRQDGNVDRQQGQDPAEHLRGTVLAQ